MTSRQTAFKILTEEEWATFDRDGVFSGTPLDGLDGFIHLSTADQLQGTLAKHFPGKKGLVIVEIDLALLGNSIRWERARDGALFPHLYGQLTRKHVIGVNPGR